MSRQSEPIVQKRTLDEKVDQIEALVRSIHAEILVPQLEESLIAADQLAQAADGLLARLREMNVGQKAPLQIALTEKVAAYRKARGEK